MQAIQSRAAISLSKAVKRAVAPDEFVNDTLNQQDELEQLRNYFARREERNGQLIAEQMIITALQNDAAPELVRAMQMNAKISETRLAELKEQALSALAT